MKDDKAAALALFLEGWEQVDIANVIGVDPRSITTWANENGKGHWKKLRLEKQLFERSSSDQVQDLITYQLKVLNKIRVVREKQIDEAGDDMDLKQLNEMLFQNGHMDGLQKLFNAIKSKELAWEDYITVVRDYTEFLHAQGFPYMAALEPFATDFIKSTRGKA